MAIHARARLWLVLIMTVLGLPHFYASKGWTPCEWHHVEITTRFPFPWTSFDLTLFTSFLITIVRTLARGMEPRSRTIAYAPTTGISGLQRGVIMR